MNKRILKFIILFFLLGMVVGFIVGYTKGLNDMAHWVAEKIIFFTEMKGGEVIVDVDMLTNGIINYKHNIDRCFENAPLYDNTGN